MEIFLAMMTGVLLGLFLAYFVHVVRDGTRQRAGQLLCRVRQQRFNYRQIFFWMLALSIVLLDALFVLPASSLNSWTASIVLGGNAFTAVVLFNFGYSCSRDLEFWEHGCLFPMSGPLFPWSKIRYCQWKDTRGTLWIVARLGRMTLRLDPNTIEMVNETLRSRVELRDEQGNAMNPELEYAYERSALGKACGFRLQFNLKTILFLMVVVASASAWVGVHLRAGWREEQLLQKLEAFGPDVGYQGNRVYRLDFSKSAQKPTDDTLRQIAEFSQLADLDLSGCPITDEGVSHLTKLKHLKWLNLANTKIGDAGLVHLAKIKSLRSLFLYDFMIPGHAKPGYVVPESPFSKEALDEFRKVMPDTRVTH